MVALAVLSRRFPFVIRIKGEESFTPRMLIVQRATYVVWALLPGTLAVLSLRAAIG